MTHIQQVHWELEMDYIGHPHYVSGNAILHAIGHQLTHDDAKRLNASHGMFVPGQFGTYPEEHAQDGMLPYMGATLPDVEAYDDLFLFRNPHHHWLLDSRARDALNTHDLRPQSGEMALAHETIMGRPEEAYAQTETTSWFIHAYLHADDPDTLPLGEGVLDGIQFGGRRNYGYGSVRLKDTQVVDLEALDYSRLRGADAYLLELVSPYVVDSEYPGADGDTVPWWWSVDHDDGLRRRAEKVVEQGKVYDLVAVDHGQVVGYAGDSPIETAKNAIRRVGTHSKYGFGELRVKPIETEESVVDEVSGTNGSGLTDNQKKSDTST